MKVTTFAGGLVTNPAEHAPREREKYAAFCRNCRSDPQGWLIQRAGMTQLSEEPLSHIFAHQSLLFAVSNAQLKWARPTRNEQTIVFQEFDTPVPITDTERVLFRSTGNLVFVADQKQQYVVDVSGAMPTVEDFYGNIGDIHLTAYRPTRTENKFATEILDAEAVYDALQDRVKNSIKIQVIDVFAQPVLEIAGERVLLKPTNALRAEVNSWDGTPDQAGTGNEGRMRAEITITLNPVTPEFRVSRNVIVELYATRRVDEGETPKKEFFRLPTTITYQPGTTQTFRLLNDDSTLGDTAPLQPGTATERLNFTSMALNEYRAYAAEEKSNTVWFSKYDPEKNQTYFQNFTNSIQLQLQGGTITGLQFIRDTLLVIYATNQIQLMATDPLFELHNVIDTVGPRDDVGNLIGCIAPDSIVDMGGEHLFLASNRYVYRFNSRTAYTISDPVQEIFNTLELPTTHTGEPKLLRATAFAYKKDYFISIPSKDEENRGEYPNTTLLYDTAYSRWWQDSYAVRDASKAYPERLYTVIDGKLYELFAGNTDNGTKIRRVWRSNPAIRRTHDKIHSVHVYAIGKAIIEVIATTEQAEERGTLIIDETSDVYSQRLGMNIRGRTLTVEIATESETPIDRIVVNQALRS